MRYRQNLWLTERSLAKVLSHLSFLHGFSNHPKGMVLVFTFVVSPRAPHRFACLLCATLKIKQSYNHYYPVILRILGFFSSSFSRKIHHPWRPQSLPQYHRVVVLQHFTSKSLTRSCRCCRGSQDQEDLGDGCGGE